MPSRAQVRNVKKWHKHIEKNLKGAKARSMEATDHPGARHSTPSMDGLIDWADLYADHLDSDEAYNALAARGVNIDSAPAA